MRHVEAHKKVSSRASLRNSQRRKGTLDRAFQNLDKKGTCQQQTDHQMNLWQLEIQNSQNLL